MSLLRRIGSGGQSPDPQQSNKIRFIRRELLRRLADDANIHQHIANTIEEIVDGSEYELTEWDRQAVQDDLAGFLDDAARHEVRPRPPTPIPVEADVPAIYDSIRGDLGQWLLTHGLEDLPPDPNTDQIRQAVDNHLVTVFSELTHADGTPVVLSRAERHRLRNRVFADLLGFGPLEPLLADDTITEIFIFPSRQTVVTQNGRLTDIGVLFDDDAHLQRIIERIFAPLGIRIDQQHPARHARLPDGSRVAAVLPTLSMDGPALTIRKFSFMPLTTENLISFNSITRQGLNFLQAVVVSGANILITGGPFTGRTALLNILAGFIPPMHRTVSVERRTELRLRHPMTTRLVAVPPEFAPDLTFAELYQTALELAPDVVVIDDTGQDAIMDLLRLMNRVWLVLAVADAWSPESALSALHDQALAEANHPSRDQIRTLITQGLDIVVHLEQLSDGRRVVTRIAEVGAEWGADAPPLVDLYRFERTGIEHGRILGELKPTENTPSAFLSNRLRGAGIDL